MENQGVQPSLTFQSSELKASNIFFFFLENEWSSQLLKYWESFSRIAID